MARCLYLLGKFAKGPSLNQKGMALGTALFVCIILGMVTLYILNTSQNKRKIQDNLTVTVSAENVKNRLINTLNSKASWELTTSHNNIYPLAGTTIVTPVPINVYDAETNEILFHSTNINSGFDANGAPCDTFNLNQGDDKCFFRYDVAVKNVTGSAGQYLVLVRAELLFKPRNKKYVFNSQKEKFSFDYTVGVDLSAAVDICQAISGTFNETNNTCSQTLTTAASCANANQTYQGAASGVTSACGVTELPQQACPAGQYLYGYDATTNSFLCREFNGSAI